MKKSRILSLLLSALLAASSLSTMAFASDKSGADTAEFTATSGDATLETVEIDQSANSADDDYFYRFYNLTGEDGAKYTVPSDALGAARYNVTFWLRSLPQINQAVNEDLVPGDADETSLQTLRFYCTGYNNMRFEKHFNSTSEWQKYECVVVTGASKDFYFQCHYNGAEDVVTFDVSDISFTPVDSDNNPTGDTFTVDGTWAPKNASNLMLKTAKADEVYNRVVIPTTETTVNVGGKDFAQTEAVLDGLGETVVLTGSEDILVPGKYTLDASFRLGWYDHAKLVMKSNKYEVAENNNNAALTSYFGDEVIGELTVNADTWTNLTYVFEVTEPIAMSEFSFELDDVAALDYKVNTVLTGNVSDEFVTADGETVYVNVVEDDDTYIRIGGRDDGRDIFAYTNTVMDWDASATYVFSFKARTDSYIESDAYTSSHPAKLRAGTALNTTTFAYGTTHFNNTAVPTEWKEFGPYEVTGFDGSVYFNGSSMGCGVAPIDIKDFTIVKKGTTENLAVNADSPLSGGAGWSIKRDLNNNAGFKTTTISTQTDTEYAAVPGGSFSFASDEIIPAGVYYLTGEFIMDEAIDYNKYEFAGDYEALISDGNVTTLGVSVNGAELETLDGETSVNVSAEGWTDVTFKLVSDGTIAKSDIIFAADSAIGVKDVVISDISEYFNTDLVDANGEYPEYVISEDDGAYIHVSGRDHNEDHVKYTNTLVDWDASATYVITLKARTESYIESETISYYPAAIRAGTSGTGAANITNWMLLTSEWTEFGPYEVTGFGGTFVIRGSGQGLSFAPFDIKDFTIVKKGTTENLAANAESLLTGGAGWSVAQDNNSLKELSIVEQTDAKYAAVSTSSFGFASDEVLPAGTYYISGDFIVDEAIDFGKYEFASDYETLLSDGNTTTLSVSVNDEASVIITSEAWTTVSFEFVADGYTALSDIVFSAGDEVALGVKNIVITDSSEYINTELVDVNGENLSYVMPEEDSYIRISGRDHNEDHFTYTNTAIDWDANATYVIFFKACTDAYIESPTIKMYPAVIRAGTASNNVNVNNWIPVTAEWSEFGPYEVTGFAGTINFRGSGQGVGFAPIDIKDLVIIKKGTTENLAVNADGVLENGAGWSVSQDKNSVKDFSVAAVTEDKYTAIPDGSFSFASEEILAAGTYYLAGEFIMDSPIDYGKYEFASDYETLLADGNTTTLVVTVNGEALEASAVIGAENWTDVTFKLVSDGSIAMSDIVVASTDEVAFGVKNIEMTYDKAAADQEKVDAVIAAIEAIGEVTLEDAEAIAAAEKAYAELGEALQGKVTNYEVLVSARAEYDKLKEIDEAVAIVGETYYTTLADALLAGGDVTLLKNIEEEVVVSCNDSCRCNS